MKPKVSIVVPAYNVEKYIEKCVNSIISQTFTDIEIILVDDGSRDSTGEICDELAFKDMRISVIHKQNEGLSDARNTGIAAADGEFICFIDGDDYIHPKYCETLFNLIVDNKADIAVCGYIKTQDYNCKVEDEISCTTGIFNKTTAMQELVTSDKFMNYAWNKMYKKSLFDGVLYPVGRNWEDLGTTYKLFDKADKIVYCNAKLYFYIQRSGSITSTVSVKNALDIFELERERGSFLTENYADLEDYLEYRSCLAAYNVWSAVLTNKFEENLTPRINEAIEYLNAKGKQTVKSPYCSKGYKIKIFLYCYLRPLLKLIIRTKRL